MTASRLARARSVLADTRPLKVPAFRRLWLADIVTVIGAQLTIVSVPAQIYAQTRDSSYVGLTGLFGLVPLRSSSSACTEARSPTRTTVVAS